MTQTAQQTPSNPALDFADAILEDTNYGLELIEILHDIAQGNDQNATTNDRIAAATILADRGFGKAPKQIDPNPAPTPKSDANDVGAIRESPSVPAANPRPVTQIKDTLDQALGPAPTTNSPQSTKNSPPSTIHFTIQNHILEITNNGQTIREALEEIARSEDYPKVTPYHRVRAVRILIDRILGTGRALTRPEPTEEKPYRRPVKYLDPVKVARARAEIQRMKDEGTLTPDPNRPKIDISKYMPPEDYVMPPEVAAEEAASFWEEINLRYERQKQWPEIEERRRRKHKEIYPSHSDDHEDDDKPPDP